MVFFFWLEILLLTYFVYVSLYTAIFSAAGRFYSSIKQKNSEFKKLKFGVFIPAYKEDEVIVSVAKLSLNQNYKDYDVIIIADSLQQETIDKLRNLPIKTIEVEFEKSTKVKALNAALSHFEGKYDYAVILDADNVMEQNFLSRLNVVHQLGYQSIQGKRAAKNQDTTMSFLDGLSEEINNHVMCKGSTFLRLSSSLKGSGMSIEYNLLKHHLSRMASVGGFDRELELRLATEGHRSLYVDDAIIYDEKVGNSKVFENQRKRWISSQFYYLRKYFFVGLLAFFKGNFTVFNSALLRNIQLPRLLNLGLLTVFTITSFILSFWGTTLYIYWVSTMIVTFSFTVLAIPNEYYGKQFVQAIFSLPMIFLRMFALLFKLRGANSKFIHTPHTLDNNGED